VTPEVSLCIRGWRADTLPRTIESALAQSFGDLEVVVADDKGDLGPVVSAFGDGRVRYERNDRQLGPTGNARRVLSLGRGRYLCLLNDDDLLLPTFVEETVARFHADATLGVVFASHLNEENGKRWPRRCDLPAGRYEPFLPLLLRYRPIAPSAALMRREVWEQLEREQPLAEPAAADLTIWLHAAAAGWPFEYLDRPLAVVSISPGQVSAGEGMRERAVAVWERFEFEDPESEQVRRVNLARARISRAASELKRRRVDEARAHLAAARDASPTTERLRRGLLHALVSAPRLIPPAVATWRAYRRLRPFHPWFTRRSLRTRLRGHGLSSALAVPTIAGVRLIPLTMHRDERGHLTELFRSDWQLPFEPEQWHVLASRKGALRGMHVHVRHADYKVPLAGRTLLVLKDLRQGSPSEGAVDALELRGDELVGVVVPPGVAHTVLALDDTVLASSANETYDPSDDFGFHWADPELGYDWPVRPTKLSERDRNAGSLRELLEQLAPYQPIGGSR
jgi:dTDP-4-dehydrorhamnose 3,5-epimerase